MATTRNRSTIAPAARALIARSQVALPHRHDITDALVVIIQRAAAGQEMMFKLPRDLQRQYCHSCCHILAEGLVYLLHGHQGIDAVSYLYLSSGSLNHSCVQVDIQGQQVFIDASGVYSSISTVWANYDSASTPYVEALSSDDIIELGQVDPIRSRSELTPTWAVISELASAHDIESAADLEDDFIVSLAEEMIRSSHIHPY